jgi:autotransporter-associated beta strand protein
MGFKKRRLTAPLALACLAYPSSRALAAPWQWTGAGANSNWSNAQNWSPASAPANDGSAAIVMTGNTRTSPNVDTAWSINSLTFNAQSSSFTLGGATLRVGSGGITNLAGVNSDQTLNLPVVLTANQTWDTGTTWATYISDQSTLNLSTFGLTITGTGGSNQEGGCLLNGVVSGSGSITVNLTSGAALAIYGANTYTGGTVLDSGEFFTDMDSSLGTATSPITFNGGLLEVGAPFTIQQPISVNSGGGTIDTTLPQNESLTISSNIQGSGTLTFAGNGGGTIQLTGINTYSGGTINNQATLVGNTSSLQGNISLRNVYSTVAFEQNANGTYAGNISGGGEVTINGSAIIDFTGSNTYTGDTQMYSGVLEVSLTGSQLSPNSPVDFLDAANSSGGPILQIVGGGTFNRPFSMVGFDGPGGFAARNGELFVNLGGAGGQFTLSPHNNLVFGSPTANSPTDFENAIYLGSAESSPEPVVEVDSGAGGDYAIISGVISGANYFAKTGTGLLVLSASNTYTGPTTVVAGTLDVTGSLAKTFLYVDNGASLGGSGFIAGSVTVRGSATNGGSINLADAFAGNLTFSDPSSSDTVLTIGGTAGNPSNLDFEVGSSSDAIVITNGKLTINPGGAMIYVFPMASFGPGVYDLIDFQPGQATGLANLSLATTSYDGYTMSLEPTSTAEELIVIPEPTTLCLMTIAACGLLGRRRKNASE